MFVAALQLQECCHASLGLYRLYKLMNLALRL